MHRAYHKMFQLAKSDIDFIIKGASQAGQILMDYYNGGDNLVSHKEDNSPVSEADFASNQHICAMLQELTPNIAIVSEENDENENLKILKNARIFWLIDPLDGTWSYLERKGHFVINIALIVDGVPAWGLIESPLTGESFYMNQHKKCCYKSAQNEHSIIDFEKDFNDGIDFLVSQQNLDQRTQDFVNQYTIKTLTPISSALKFGLLANGIGDIYPRFKRTCIWDTAAGHAMLLACGGDIFDVNGDRLRYDGSIYNPDFIAYAKTWLAKK